MLSNKFFLIGFGGFYAVAITLIALFFSKKVFRFLNKFNNEDNGEYTIKIIALFFSTFIWIFVIAIFWNISWRLPIDNNLWNYFSSSHLIIMWLTLIFYFRKNSERI